MELLESIRNERFVLEMMYDYLGSLSTRIYEIDYRPLETLDNIDTVDLINFKRYIDSRFESLLETYHLKKNGRYDDSSFYIKTDLIRFRQSMTFKEFIDENFSRIYANAESVNMVDYDSEDIDSVQRKSKRYKASVYKECEDELSMLRDFSRLVKDVVDSFDDFSDALDRLNSEILEEFELNRDKWYRADDDETSSNLAGNERSIAEMKRETTLLCCKLFNLMHKHYSVDQQYLNTLSRVRLNNLHEELRLLANKFGLENVNTYYDSSFDLKPFNLSESDLTAFTRFISENSVLDTGLREYFDSKVISDDILELNKFTNIIRDAIKMFNDFESALEHFNDKLLKRVDRRKKARDIESSKAHADNNIAERIDNLAEALAYEFYQLKRELSYIYKVHYQSIKNLKDVDIVNFEHFKDDIDFEINSLLSSCKLRKDNVSTITGAFELNPVELVISKDMSLLRFISSNLSKLHDDTMFIDTICCASAETLSDKIKILLSERIMTEKEVEKEFSILEDFIESVNDTCQAYDRFRDELNEINENLVNEYKSSYCR